MKNLLVIDYSSVDWYKLFKDKKLKNGEKIKVEVAGWQHITVNSSNKKGVICHLKGIDNLYQQKDDREFSVDFILIRNFSGGLHEVSYKNILLAFMFNNIPSINSLKSIFLREKPILYGELLKIQQKLGKDNFPIVDQNFYPNIGSSDEIIIKPDLPCVLKIGTIDAGVGKMKVKEDGDLEDFLSCLTIHNDYFFVEPFLNIEYDLRLQKIGKHYRVYSRQSNSSWKQNWGNIAFKDHEVTDKYKLWMDEVSLINGGLDMFALDVMRLKDGTDLVLEVNDTAMGLMFDHIEEDCGHIRDLTLEKMNEHFQ
eukprot:gene2665-3861_t